MKKIRLTQNKVALVDDIDYAGLNQWNWYAAKSKFTYYVQRQTPKHNKMESCDKCGAF